MSRPRQPGAALAFSGLPITAGSVGMRGSGGTVANEVGANKSMPSKASKAQPVALRVEFEYHHDMGDGWRHRIVVGTVPVAWREFELPLPVCTAGEHACPPEDVGGPHGYKKFRAAITNPEHEEFGALLNWIGGVFDPKGFDINRINKEWRAAKRRRGSAN